MPAMGFVLGRTRNPWWDVDRRSSRRRRRQRRAFAVWAGIAGLAIAVGIGAGQARAAEPVGSAQHAASVVVATER
jgi:hypothetical protein